MGENKNFILFAVISMAILLGYNFLVAGPKKEAALREYQRQQQELALQQDSGGAIDAPAIDPDLQTPSKHTPVARSLALEDAGFVKIDTPELSGSISLRGARFDDLSLKNHNIEQDENSDNIHLFNKLNGSNPYFASFGWFDQTQTDAPTVDSAWTADNDTLTPETPVTLAWDNGKGVRYLIKVAVDNQFMFTVTQSVVNTSGAPVTVAPYGAIERRGTPETDGMIVLHEGMIGVFNDALEEISYDDIKDDGTFDAPTKGGWMGITDKFWMSSLIPDQSADLKRARLRYRNNGGTDTYFADYLQDWRVVASGASFETTNRLYAGAKIVEAINDYQEQYDIPLFDRAIDWGWFWFLTQPIFFGLHWLFVLTGNYGIAILLMTVVLKGLVFPLANKSYRSMAHMKKAQPKIKALQERYKDDKQRMQQEMMALYQKEKINPMAGCLPMIPQIFIFFALYKTLYVTIEMRHQPFFGWITDLSAKDPLTPLNAFGLIPWDPPSFIAIGVLPILMGVSMYFQQKLNPQTNMDPAQQKIMNMLPIIFTFIMANFSAGLVLYWTWNNILTIAQQTFIMKRENAKTEGQ
ncbi:membrane protein insertase YidC [Kordiimonas laminariae]|uniref:membrane protein insertase YidC n=1 Tax=Kordiimonas laminariae TaxID=2917717 RepID=UPI001FF4D64B|nr:membrane protein insertase YidC [Kordiimonas laminariae]MCK0069349.1 membrane protein insertase YidC [Kordiimonas laminariae]